MKIFNRYFFFLISSFIIQTVGFGQETNKDQDVGSSLYNKNYVFIPRSVQPQSGRSINLTTEYTLQLKGDTLVSDLPYFGRAYVAPINTEDGGIHFTSNNFSYDLKERKKGGWNILIVPKDAKDVRQMVLTVFDNKSASLLVISNNRQSINYNGTIEMINK